MSYIKFDKNQLVNLEFSLNRELIRSNRAGAYASKTIVGCNTRKYHGLLVVPQPALDDDNHVLIANLDETIIQHDAEFNLGIHKYPGGIYQPKGHKYIEDFNVDPIPNSTYRVGGVVLKRSMLFAQSSELMMISYTLVDAHSPTILRLRPFLAFRNAHTLSRANVEVNKKYDNVDNGIRMRLYPGYSWLYMQFSKPPEYTHVPDWYYNIEYQQEMDRGYEYQEDLLVPGFFDLRMKKGETVIFCAGTEEIDAGSIRNIFRQELGKRIPRNNFENCLVNAAQQFIVRRGKRTDIIAGFPWFGRWGRDTFMSLPGLTLTVGDEKTFRAVTDTMVKDMQGPLFPNYGIKGRVSYDTVDAPLWYFWALQQFVLFTGQWEEIWKAYGRKMKSILEGLSKGTDYNIHMLGNGLLYAGEPGKALTWMDVIVNGRPVTPRKGLAVEVNALWYNAIMFAMELAGKANDKHFIADWRSVAEMIPSSFTTTFWDEKKGYAADFVDEDYRDFSIRPNMVIATSLPYSPLDEEKRNSILEIARKILLTPRGLRSLSPTDPQYKGFYGGDQKTRDEAYHQGSVWPWLLGHFAEGYLKIYGKSGISFISSIYKGFEPTMREHGIGTISEIYDGDPPHRPGGAISQAWNVAELLRMNWLMEQYSRKIELND